jgi:hypothetical protein
MGRLYCVSEQVNTDDERKYGLIGDIELLSNEVYAWGWNAGTCCRNECHA